MKYFKFLMVSIFLFSQLAYAAEDMRVLTDNQIKDIADPILDNILEGFALDSYFKYARDFDDTLKVSGAKTKFYELNRYIETSLGRYISREYMGSLRKGQTVVVMWKAVFNKYKEGILIKLVLFEKNRKYRVSGLWLQ